jgi:hypothetical protein
MKFFMKSGDEGKFTCASTHKHEIIPSVTAFTGAEVKVDIAA